MQKGFFITFEGGEGCGKSSHIKALCEHFELLGRTCIKTREPGGTPLGEKIRELLLHAKEGVGMSTRAEIMLFEAARAQHVDELIKPALMRGEIVLCDRFADSTSAYQGVARKLDANAVEKLNNFATDNLQPDLTIILDISATEGIARAAGRDAGKTDRMGAEKLEFYEAVRSAFLRMAKDNPKRFAVVDSSGTKEETFKKILAVLQERGIR